MTRLQIFITTLVLIFSLPIRLHGYAGLGTCEQIPRGTEGLILFDQNLSLINTHELKREIAEYLETVHVTQNRQVFTCKIDADRDSSLIKNLLKPLKSLSSLMFVGDFPAPIVVSQETWSSNFDYKAPDPTPSYYFYGDFVSKYQRLDDNSWKCLDCTDKGILDRVSFPIGIVRSFRSDGLDILNYFKRVNAFRRSDIETFKPKAFVARSGFDSLRVLSFFDDPKSDDSGYPEIAKAMGLHYKSFIKASHVDPEMKDDSTWVHWAKGSARRAFAEKGLIFSSLMHGNNKFAGGNSTVGPFLNSDEPWQLGGGSAFNVFHSCSTGAELSPKSLVYYDELIGESTRLGVVAALVDTHRLSVIPNNLIALSMGRTFGETALAISNSIEMTYFGDPLLTLTDTSKNRRDYFDLIKSSGRIFSPRALSSFCRVSPDFCETRKNTILELSLNAHRGSLRAAAVLGLPIGDFSDLLEIKSTIHSWLTDPHPLVRSVAMKKIFSHGFNGVQLYDDILANMPENFSIKIKEQNQRGLDPFEYSDFLVWDDQKN